VESAPLTCGTGILGRDPAGGRPSRPCGTAILVSRASLPVILAVPPATGRDAYATSLPVTLLCLSLRRRAAVSAATGSLVAGKAACGPPWRTAVPAVSGSLVAGEDACASPPCGNIAGPEDGRPGRRRSRERTAYPQSQARTPALPFPRRE